MGTIDDDAAIAKLPQVPADVPSFSTLLAALLSGTGVVAGNARKRIGNPTVESVQVYGQGKAVMRVQIERGGPRFLVVVGVDG